MKGYAVCEFFSKSLTADLEIELNDKTLGLEIQSAFTETNDINRHKAIEAK